MYIYIYMYITVSCIFCFAGGCCFAARARRASAPLVPTRRRCAITDIFLHIYRCAICI